MRQLKIGVMVAATAVALAGCGSYASGQPAVSTGTTVNGCTIAPNANCAGKKLVAADLHDADLSGANLTGADLSYANLMSANLTNANLTNAKIWYTNLQSADLTGANVTNASFANANMIHATCPNGSEARNSTCVPQN